MKVWERIALDTTGCYERWREFAECGSCEGIVCDGCPFAGICKYIHQEDILSILNKEYV